MNNQRVSKLLLQYAVAGRDQALKANTDITVSLKEAEAAAKQYGTTVERLQELGNMRIAPVAISSGSVALLRQAEALQESQVAAANQQLKAEEAISREIQNQTGLLKRFNDVRSEQTRRLIATESPTDDALRGIRRRSVPGTLNTVRDALIAAPGIGYQNPAVVALRGISTLSERTGASFKQLGAGLGIAAVAVAGVAVAMKSFNDQMAEAKRRLEGALQAQNAFYDALTKSTSSSVQAQITDLERVRDAQLQQLQETRTALETGFQQAQSVIGGNVSFIGDAVARLLDNQTGASQLREQVERLDVQFNTTNDTISRLRQGLSDGQFAANDMRAAEEALAQQRTDFAQYAAGIVKIQTDRELRLLNLRVEIDQLTEEQREERLAQERSELDLINARLRQGGLTIEAEATLRERQGALIESTTYLSEITDTHADVVDREAKAREAATEATRAQLDALEEAVSRQTALSEAIRTASVEQVADRLHAIEEEQDAIKNVLPQLEALAPTSELAAEQLAQARARLGELNSDYFQFITQVLPAAQARARQELEADLEDLRSASRGKIEQINADLLEKQGEALAKRDEDYLAAEEKRGEAVNELAEELAERRKKIEQKANTDLENAIFERDALAAYKARQRRDEDLAELEADGKARQKEIDEQFAKERAAADRNYDKALKQAQDAHQKAILQEGRKLQLEIQQRQAAYNQELALLNGFNIQGVQLIGDFVSKGLTWLQQLASGITGGGNGNGITPQPPGGGGGSVGLPPVSPQIGQVWTDGTGKSWVWTGRGWQPATVVQQSASRNSTLQGQGTSVFSQSPRPQQMLFSRQGAGGMSPSATINLNLDGKTIVATSRAQAIQVVEEVFDDVGIA